MLYAIQFTNRHDRDQVRVENREAHHAYLHTVEDRVLAAGTLAEPGGEVNGALWIVRADSREEAEALFAGDPYWQKGLRAGYHVYEWNRLFPGDREAVIP